MLKLLKQVVDRSPALTALNYFKGQLLFRLGLQAHQSGATHAYVGDSVGYISHVGQDYLTYGANGDASRLQGKRILEIGPGDNLGVAIWLIAKGARSVTCIDRFAPLQDASHNAAIYRKLLDTFNAEERARAERAFSISEGDVTQFNPDLIDCRYGVAIETADQTLGAGVFEIVLSRAVLEHVFDLQASWRAMTKLLTPQGQMWHKVDFRNHRLFEQFHPLYFLTFGDAVWNLISSPDPTLNRQLLPTYRQLAGETFNSSNFYITHLIGREELLPHPVWPDFEGRLDSELLQSVKKIKPRLASPYRDFSDADLAIAGAFVVCQGKKT